MRRRRNRGVVYTGKVGAKLRPRRWSVSRRRVPKVQYRCNSGPLKGHCIWLDPSSGHTTLPIVVRGERGHYYCGTWIQQVTA